MQQQNAAINGCVHWFGDTIQGAFVATWLCVGRQHHTWSVQVNRRRTNPGMLADGWCHCWARPNPSCTWWSLEATQVWIRGVTWQCTENQINFFHWPDADGHIDNQMKHCRWMKIWRLQQKKVGKGRLSATTSHVICEISGGFLSVAQLCMSSVRQITWTFTLRPPNHGRIWAHAAAVPRLHRVAPIF